MRRNKKSSELEMLLRGGIARKYHQEVKRGNKFCVIYTRVSSKEQAENNSSLETQLRLCKEYAKREGLIVKQYFGGTYDSAKTDGRKEFVKMLDYVKKDVDISFIIVWNFERFSRTGPAAAQLSSELSELGIILKSVSQNIDNTTPSGQMQENIFHIFSHYDNQQRSIRTKVNTKEVMLQGYWAYKLPTGYENLKPKHKASEHQYIITDEGRLLKKAFQWKAEGVLSNKEIADKLAARGVRLTEKNFRWIISNPFYAGYITGKLLNYKLVKGHHPPLVDLETYLKANKILKDSPVAGIARSQKVDELPLKIFVKDALHNSPFTGYIKKGNWYYKARHKGVGVNISAKKLNGQFELMLSDFEYKKEYKEKLSRSMVRKLKDRLESSIKGEIQLKKRKTELQNQLEEIEERYILKGLEKGLYEKYAAKFNTEISKIEDELTKYAFSSSNLEMAVEKCLAIAEKISQAWVSGNYAAKQKIQYLLFPDGIVYDNENGTVRTLRTNSVFASIPLLASDLGKMKKGNSEKNCLESQNVDPYGFEP